MVDPEAGEPPVLREARVLAAMLALHSVAAAAGDSPSQPIPSDAELEAKGARIGDVRIVVDDVFEARPGRDWNGLYRLANRLHASTDTDTIEPQLLFNSGDPYVRRNLDETARILRTRRYFNDASVVPVLYHEDNTVDVEVRAHDVWTLTPGISFGRSGGANRSSVELKDSNFLGWGKTIGLERSSNVDRTSWLVNYNDPNLLGSWWHLGLDYADSSDGYLHAATLERPFYSLDTPWSFAVTASSGLSTVSRYDRGEIIDQFDADRGLLDIDGGWFAGRHDGWITRYLGGMHYERNRFTPGDQPLVGVLPEDRTLTYPWAGIEWLEDNFRTTRNLNQIGRTEDIRLGRSLRLTAGVADPIFGSDRSALMLGATTGAGVELGTDRFLLGSASFTGRVEGGGLSNGLFETETSFYARQSPRRVFFASLTGEFGNNLDPDHQILLGGDNGLRGYPLRYQAGSARATLTLEERFYTDWRPFQLFQVGGAVFFDAGRVWGDDPVAGPSSGLLKDVGLGLRFGSLRSGLGNVIHVDLAMPLDREPGIDGVQLLIETRRSF